MPALKDNLLKFGVLRCRELVELYFGWRLVASVIEKSNNLDNTKPQLILGQDPRRIRYEIIVTNPDATAHNCYLDASPDAVTNIASEYAIAPHSSLIIERTFLSDLDAVTMPVWGQAGAAGLSVATRETFLTPAPVDEVPLG